MGEAWIYTSDQRLAGELAGELAELGFSPRRVSGASGSLRPGGEDGAAAGRPDLALVIDEPELCARLDADEELRDVPVVLAVEPAALARDRTGALVERGHELVLRPFSAAELGLRVARARRRVRGVDPDDVVRVGTLEVNLATYQVAIDGRPVDFAYMEYELLKFLLTHPGRVFSREALLSRVWGYDYYGGARTVDVHVRRVRAKLGQEHAARIKTVRSVGYRFES